MNERPILFSGPMITAIREGRKTQTRRVVKPQPIEGVYKYDGVTPTFQWRTEINTCRPIWPDVMNQYCPYGQPGDRLWVRETWHLWGPPEHEILEFRADCADPELYTWRPSIFMPRWASRITLEITGVRVERVQDISGYDAVREGIAARMAPRDAFAALWDSINAKRGYGWDSNPWVWIVEFREVTR